MEKDVSSEDEEEKLFFGEISSLRLEIDIFLLMFHNRRVDRVSERASPSTLLYLPCCTNFPINNSMLMDPNNAACTHTRT